MIDGACTLGGWKLNLLLPLGNLSDYYLSGFNALMVFSKKTEVKRLYAVSSSVLTWKSLGVTVSRS
jgi:hypothetical protein